MLNVNQVAGRLGVHYNSVYTLIKTGELKAYRFGKKKISIREEDFKEFMAKREVKATK